MHNANDCYKLSEIPEFKDVLLNESNEIVSNKKCKKTTYITKNNNKYNIIQIYNIIRDNFSNDFIIVYYIYKYYTY